MESHRSLEVRGKRSDALGFLAVGHLAVDVHEDGRALGGASAYASLTASRLGLAAGILTATGEDFDLFDSLAGVEVHFRRGPESTSFQNDYGPSGRSQMLLGWAPRIEREDVAGLASRLTDTAIVLYCPIAQEITAPLVKLKEEGLCGLAPQGFFRRWDKTGRVYPSNWDDPAPQVNVISVSESDPPRLEDFLLRMTQTSDRLIAVTLGGRGALVQEGPRCFHVPARPVTAVDPTGAGDVFAASFLIELVANRSPVEAAQFACCAASFAVEKRGIEGVPRSRGAVEARLGPYRERHSPTEWDRERLSSFLRDERRRS